MIFRSGLLLLVMATVSGCSMLGTQIEPRAEPSPTTIAVEVASDEWVIGELESQVAAKLREQIRVQNIGVPVVQGAAADMTLRVKVNDTNFTQALSWEWQLVDSASGTIVDSRSESSVLGHSADNMAELIVSALVEVDTAAYAGDGPRVPVVRRSKDTVEGPEPPLSQTDGSKTWVVVVGVEKYRNELPPASHAESDARAFAALAQRTLGVPETQIKVLLGQRATRTDVMGAVSEWLPRNASEPGGRVFFYFSGHGAPNAEDKGAYLVPWDADPAYLKTGGILVSDVQKELASLKGQQVFVMVDACFSGAGDRSVLAEGTRPLVPVSPAKQVGSLVTMTAAGAGETTGVASDRAQGLFTRYVLSGLSGEADADGDASVTVSELVEHVRKGVELDARRQNGDQRPTVTLPKGSDASSLVLVRGLEVAP